MQLIEGSVRSYAWGSRTALAELTGREAPTDHPEAEIWFGAHPAAPSTVVSEDVALDEFIAADPATQVGEGHDTLPFLLKLLAADKALSLQAHPTKEQAEQGFAAENAAGVPLDAFQRNYKDDNHKPELIVALTEFHALAGFRAVAQTRELLEALDIPELSSYIALLGSGDDAADLRGLFTTWVSLPRDFVVPLISAVVERCRALVNDANGTAVQDWMLPSLGTVVTLAQEYPGDAGIICSLLLNRVTLQPGEGLYLDAGQLHAYLGGVGVEIMANSDNVLRGGLTTKHIDVAELMRVLRCEPLGDPRLTADEDGVYPTPAPEFQLRRLTGGESRTVTGPAIVLSVGAGVTVEQQQTGTVMDLARGHAVWIAAGADSVTATAETAASQGETAAFIATVGS